MIYNIQYNTAVSVYRYAVELIYSLRSPAQDVYDIRNHTLHPQPSGAFPAWLNTGEVQQAIGVDLNYSGSNSIEVFAQFHITGDWVRSKPLQDLRELLEAGTRVALMFGDADYILNWQGGQDLSLAVNYSIILGLRASAIRGMCLLSLMASAMVTPEKQTISPSPESSMRDTTLPSISLKLLFKFSIVPFMVGTLLLEPK